MITVIPQIASLKNKCNPKLYFNHLSVCTPKKCHNGLVEILEMGLVQGSSLSCLLFIIYVNDFFQSNTLFSVAFVDDTNVASKCKNLNTQADTVNKELEKITCWYMSNKLTNNFEKTNAILFSNSQNAQNEKLNE